MGNLSVWHLAVIGVLGLIALSAFGSRRGSIATYVIKKWFASETPSAEGMYIHIVGRKGGLLSWLLSLVGIDPTVELTVDRENVRFRIGSWTGYQSWVTPLQKLCSGHYGYSKPFWGTLVWVIIGLVLLSDPLGLAGYRDQSRWLSLGLPLIVILSAIGYYFLNKTIVLGLTYIGGGVAHSVDQFAFKRSLIEGQHIDEGAAERIISIIEMIVLGADKPRPVGRVQERPDSATVLAEAKGELRNLATRALSKTESIARQVAQASERAATSIGSTASDATAASSKSAKCPGCGVSVASNDLFCANCGHKLR